MADIERAVQARALASRIKDTTNTTFKDFTTGQKAVTIIAIIAVIVAVFFTYRYVSTPKMSLLYSNLSPKEASTAVTELEKQSVTYTLDQAADGTTSIFVPADKQNRLRLSMAETGVLSADKQGYSLLDNTSITTSEFLQQANWQRAIEGELERTIGDIRGVESASVHLALPDRDLFSKDAIKPTASVALHLDGTTTLRATQIKSIVNLVASAVEGLQPQDVAVSDQHGTLLADPMTGGAASGQDAQAERTQAFEDRLAKKIEDQLAVAVGPGNAKATVTAQVSYNSEHSTSETFGKDNLRTGIPLQTTTSLETYKGDGGTPVGILGPDGAPIAGVNGQTTTYTGDRTTTTNAVDRTVTEKSAGGGGIERVSASVLVNADATDVNVAQLQKLVEAAIGFNRERGDVVVVNTAPFNKEKAETLAKENEKRDKAIELEQTYMYIRSGGLAALVVIILFIAWRAARKAKRAEPEPIDLTEMDFFEEFEPEPDVVEELDPVINVTHEVNELIDGKTQDVVSVVRGWMAQP